MGTYGVTHVKNNNKIIALSDSYDGYMGGGMGQANILCIKYLSTPVLKKLFDQYSASAKVDVNDTSNYDGEDSEEDETQLSQRQLDNAIYQVEQDMGDPEVVEWMKNTLSDDIRTSSTGFAPLLYLNINPHYGRDYEYCDYMVDLDKEEFLVNGMPVPFERIRSASINQLNVFCNSEQELVPEEIREELENLWDEDFSSMNPEEIKTNSEKLINAYLTIENEKIEAFYKKRDEDHKAYMEQHYPNGVHNHLDDDLEELDDDDSYGAYSLRSATVSPSNLRLMVTLFQKLKKEIPECEFLSTHTEWSMNQDYTEGGFRSFSPMDKDKKMHEIYDQFMLMMECKLKIRTNIFTSTGKWSFDVKHDDMPEEDNLFMFSEVIPGPAKSILSIDEVKALPGYNNDLNEVHPYLSIHAEYSDIRPYILNQNANIVSPIIWVYMALLNQDKEVFDKVYPLAKEAIKTFEMDKQKPVYVKYLDSFNGGITVNQILEQFATILGKTINPSNEVTFIEHLKTTTFFQDVESAMTKAEKVKYLSSGSKVKMK